MTPIEHEREGHPRRGRARRILYLMHVDWNWIKQRPHFLAEQLATRHNVLVVYRASRMRLRLPGNPTSVARLPLLPIPRRWGTALSAIDQLAQLVWLSIIGWVFRPDTIWLTFPTAYSYLPSWLRRKAVVYDCMDDALAFNDSARGRERLRHLERRVTTEAEQVIASSDELARRLAIRYGVTATVVRNALSSRLLTIAGRGVEAQAEAPTADSATRPCRIGYIGTIASWVDIDLLRNCAQSLSNVEFHLVGPGPDLPLRNERIVAHGPVAHDTLPRLAGGFQALVLPFILNDLTRAVDPVKLYEYLAYGKEVLTIYYDELDHFAPFVHFYRSPDEFVSLVRALVERSLPRRNVAPRVGEFLRENTWTVRGQVLDELLDRRGPPLEAHDFGRGSVTPQPRGTALGGTFKSGH